MGARRLKIIQIEIHPNLPAFLIGMTVEYHEQKYLVVRSENDIVEVLKKVAGR